jgi:flagellar biosynthesis protein
MRRIVQDGHPEKVAADRPSAVALSSASDSSSLVVVAKGYGAVADLIVERAQAHGLYVHASPDLVKLLMNVDLDARVPPQLYAAVGELLCWLHQLEADAATD